MLEDMYECVKELYLDKYDESGFRKDGYIHIPIGSKWQTDYEYPLFIGGVNSVHLDRVWKSKNAKTWQWIEIDEDTLKEHFKKI